MRLAVPVKAIGQRFALPILVLASVAMIILGKADTLLFERLRGSFGDIAAPVLGVLSDGFTLIGINAFTFNIILGAAILAAMLVNIHMTRMGSSRPAE